jgi:PEP-CTERM motif
MRSKRFLRCLAVWLVIPVAACAGTILTSFTNDADGWTHAPGGDLPSTVTWLADYQGHSGVLSGKDAAVSNGDYFLAPSAFLGNWSNAMTISFDYFAQYGGNLTVILQNGTVSSQATQSVSGGGWIAMQYQLATSSGWTSPGMEWDAFLSNISTLKIGFDVRVGPETDYLDNVALTLGGVVPEPGSMTLVGLALILAAMAGAVCRVRNQRSSQ